MKSKFINLSLNFINHYYPNYEEQEIAYLKYGIEGLYLFITKISLILVMAIFLNILYELFLFILSYSLIRLFSFGLHFDSSLECFIASSISFLGLPYLSMIISINSNYKIIIGILVLTVFFIYSPADTKKRPIINAKRRFIYKTLSLSVAIILLLTSLLTKDNLVSNIILFSLILQSIIIHPLTYKLFKLPYNNYKLYKEVRL